MKKQRNGKRRNKTRNAKKKGWDLIKHTPGTHAHTSDEGRIERGLCVCACVCVCKRVWVLESWEELEQVRVGESITREETKKGKLV